MESGSKGFLVNIFFFKNKSEDGFNTDRPETEYCP